MALSRKNKLAIAVSGVVVLLAGCDNPDHTNNWDTSSARSGDATAANTSIQEIQTWPPAAYKTTVGSGG
ncbi:hypothetical protein RXV86_12845 [Alisedimentitalea sp. MJ-SS2]|uniref:hypothetical protein n=1 Tax=Aliisedimentitalea sp. MJ-SS2 TaxID=3049795 RepID=UPI00290B62F5|nr:hypothetical protein [Alisedimentitalea sp. MJ-SS2]MDU8928276.1 hypothetical protein [Alisedimentitalea sp. MJ-SS2]